MLHTPLEPINPWRVVQGPTDLWYWDRLGRARIRFWDLEYAPTFNVEGSRPFLPDASQSIMQILESHLGSVLDEALYNLLPQK